jgi:hypothetical protein
LVIDRLAIGLETTLTISKDEFVFPGNNVEVRNTGFTVGPFVRYCLKNGLFAEASVGIGPINQDIDDEFGGNESDLDLFSYEIGVGYAIFFNNSVSPEPFLSYQFENQTQNENETDTSSLNLGVGFTFCF